MSKRNPVEQLYFKFDQTSNKSKCLVEDCTRILTGRHAANLERHIEKIHPNEFKKLLEKKQRPDAKLHKVQGTLDSSIIITKKKINLEIVEMDKNTLINACIELISENGRPLSMLEDSGFKKILDPLMKAIEPGFSINRHNIKNHIELKYNNMIISIKNKLKNKLICLKIDGVTRLDRSILGVNCQFMHNDKCTILTLGLIELLDKHTGSYLKDVLLTILNRYEITPDQVYTITCDNAKNMIKMVDCFNLQEYDPITEEDEESEDCLESNIENENSDEVRVTDSLELENLVVNSVLDQFPSTTCIRCAVHTFQLCIYDALKDRSINGTLLKARKVVKSLRTQTYAAWLKREGLKQAILDIETRWNSTYNMLNRLLELKEFCVKNAPKLLNINDWNSIKRLVNDLEPPKIATMEMQANNLTPGDCFGIWLNTIMKLEKLQTPLSKKILTSIKSRQNSIFKNPVFESALYLDPRYQHLMSDDSKLNAVNFLIKTWNLFIRVKNHSTISKVKNDNRTITNEELEIDNPAIDDTKDEFQLYIDSLSNTENVLAESITPIRIILNSFDNTPKILYSEKINNFWTNKKNEMPELYQLAQILMTVPTTQVSVERLFSSLKFILGDLRSKLGTEILEQIMLLRSNSDTFE